MKPGFGRWQVGNLAALLKSWGPFGAMLLAVLDSAGIPLPAGVDAMITLVSVSSPARAYLTAVLCIAGSAAGCMLLYLVARKGGQLYLDRQASSPRALRFRAWFARYGLLTVFIPALVPIPLPMKVFVLSAGALGVRPLSFLLTILAARTPRYLGLAYLGSKLGEESWPWVQAHALHLAGLAAGLFLVLLLLIRYQDRRPAGGTLALLCCPLMLGSAAGEPVDWIVTARSVVTMDAARRVIDSGAIAIHGSRIVAVGPQSEIARRFQPRQRLMRPNSLVVPGLVNTHTHAAMSLFRGLADDLRLQEWLEKFIFPAEARNLNAEFVRWGTRLACLEMLLSGTTTFTDMYYFEDAVAEATKEAGMRGVLGQTIIGFPVADAKTPADSLRLSEKFLDRFRDDPLVVPAVAPHALYTNTDDTLRQARALANRFNAPLLIHLSETRRENEETLARRGLSPVKVLDQLGVWNGRSVGAHGVWLDDGDLSILAKRGVGIAHCPSSNMKLSSGVAPVLKMLSLGIAVGIGPDGPAGSNNDFNLFEEMDLAAKLQKITTGDPQALPAEQALAMATIGGARVLGLDSQIGSLEPGKRADLIAVSLDAPHAEPLYNAASQLVYALKGSDVSDVMINGRLVVRNRQALTLNARAVIEQARRYQQQIVKSLRP
jgi:5-methylthioadenosine/S-adenosylhomocysteine deaminase